MLKFRCLVILVMVEISISGLFIGNWMVLWVVISMLFW